MKRKTITIENDLVHIPTSGEIWMTQHEITLLFDCFVAKVTANIRAILKTKVLYEPNVCRTYYYQNGNSVEQYNLEMITALSFRIKSRNSDIFRQWVMQKAVVCTAENPILIIGKQNKTCFSLN